MAETKHLEFLQAVITRLAGNSFLIKGWSVTLTSAIVGFAVKDAGPAFALVGLVPIVAFAFLDAYYLGLERAFRKRFEAAAAAYLRDEKADFDMSVGFAAADYFAALKRLAVWLFHGLLAGLVLAAALFLFLAAPTPAA